MYFTYHIREIQNKPDRFFQVLSNAFKTENLEKVR